MVWVWGHLQLTGLGRGATGHRGSRGSGAARYPTGNDQTPLQMTLPLCASISTSVKWAETVPGLQNVPQCLAQAEGWAPRTLSSLQHQYYIGHGDHL